jgi:hypothetical protein
MYSISACTAQPAARLGRTSEVESVHSTDQR